MRNKCRCGEILDEISYNISYIDDASNYAGAKLHGQLICTTSPTRNLYGRTTLAGLASNNTY